VGRSRGPPGVSVGGAVTQPWLAEVEFRALPPEEFAAFDEPGYVKIVSTLEAEELAGGESIARTRTRVSTTDATARRHFRGYWAALSPGILLIRYEMVYVNPADLTALQLATDANDRPLVGDTATGAASSRDCLSVFQGGRRRVVVGGSRRRRPAPLLCAALPRARA
jgi:hypothetical protein